MLRVVLADDENKVILLMQKLIDWDALGYEIVGIANDGIGALQLVKEKQPDLLITDIRMPGYDGLELIRCAKELQPKLHSIIISGYRQFEYAQSALKYGVEDYLLKPLKQEELEDILLRVKEKLGKDAKLQFQLKKSGEHRQDGLLRLLKTAAETQASFLSAAQASEEYGFHFGKGVYFAALVKPDIPYPKQHKNEYQIMMHHALEIVRRETALLSLECAVAGQTEGIAVLIYLQDYKAIDVKQCFTKIRKEIEKQRDLFWEIQCTISIGSRVPCLEQAALSMQQALWLCRDRLCHPHHWYDAETQNLDCSVHYQMDTAQKKRFEEAAEYLDADRFTQELKNSYACLLQAEPLNGQILQDWFSQTLEASLYGMQQNSKVEEHFLESMQENFWRCTDMHDVFFLLQQSIQQQITQLRTERAKQELKPITEAKRYIQQHYQEALRLEEVSRLVGFNTTYFSVLFKNETGQNFMDYLTELRINKSKELLCSNAGSIQDVAEQVGYRDLKYFSRLFKKITGVSPSDYRKLYQ